MKRLLITTTVATTASMGLASAAAACASFVAHSPGEQREAYHVDLTGDGPGDGDKLVGGRVLNDADGNLIGMRYWVQDVQGTDADGVSHARVGSGVTVVDDGVIFNSLMFNFPGEAAGHGEKMLAPASGTSTFDIIGGTKAYAGARGTITVEAVGGSNSNDAFFRYEVECD
ncbi:hypothetical protein [Bauldia sp.]|uniref:hypothetical protein n=1 Tax=Bauldia sp. TaxID=2575872 RepID=UPI003BA9A1B0